MRKMVCIERKIILLDFFSFLDFGVMAFPHNHKTALILDRGPYFLKSSEELIDIDIFNRTRTPGIIPMAPLTKSLWTCNVESCMEFCRVVFDIYPSKKLVSRAA